MKMRLLTLVAAALLPAAASAAAELSVLGDLHDFRSGNVTRISTQGDPGAGPIHLSIAHPMTWESVPPPRPPIIRWSRTKIGDLTYSLTLNVSQEKPELFRMTQKDARIFFQSSEWAAMMAPSPAVVHSRSAITFEGFPAGRIDFTIPLEEGRTRNLGVVFARDGRFVSILASVYGAGDPRVLDARFQEARPLFEAMHDSAVLHDVWLIAQPPGTPFDRGPEPQPGRLLAPQREQVDGLVDVDRHFLFAVALLAIGGMGAVGIRLILRSGRMTHMQAAAWALGVAVLTGFAYLAIQTGLNLPRAYTNSYWFASTMFIVAHGIFVVGTAPRRQRGPTSQFGPTQAAPMVATPINMGSPVAQAFPAAMPLPPTPANYGTPPYGAPPGYTVPQAYGSPQASSTPPGYSVLSAHGAPQVPAAPSYPAPPQQPPPQQPPAPPSNAGRPLPAVPTLPPPPPSKT